MRVPRSAGWWPCLLAAMLVAMPATPAQARERGVASERKPVVIAHRGASALRPEHTLEAYAKGIADGADFIEPDLVMTADGVLIARHENAIGGTTDVASHAAFAGRRTTRMIDGEAVTDWFSEDFTLAEIRQLRARERLPQLRGTAHDGRHAVPTLVEIVALVERESRARRRAIGLIPEIKHSSHFHARGLDPEQALARVIDAGAGAQRMPFGIQSFEVANLKRLHARLAAYRNVFLVQLIGRPETVPVDRALAGERTHDYASMLTPAGLRAIATYARAIAPSTRAVLPIDADGRPGAPTRLVGDAHAAGLEVHVWTLRPENCFLPPGLRCGNDPDARCEAGAIAEAQAFAEAGVDGVFADDPALARRAFDALSD